MLRFRILIYHKKEGFIYKKKALNITSANYESITISVYKFIRQIVTWVMGGGSKSERRAT